VNLAQILGERRELGALVRIAEERIEHSLHATQVRLDLVSYLREQQALPRTFAELSEARRIARYGLSCGSGSEAREHRIDLLRKVGRQTRKMLERVLGQ
jgi:hypothetical protein